MEEIGTRDGGQLDELPRISGTRGDGVGRKRRCKPRYDIEIFYEDPVPAGMCGKIANRYTWVIANVPLDLRSRKHDPLSNLSRTPMWRAITVPKTIL